MTEITINEKHQFLFEPWRFKGSFGGRGGSKTWDFARALLIQAVQGRKRILCAREIQNSIKTSVYQVLRDQIAALGLDKYYTQLKDELRCDLTGSEFFFKGLRSNIAEIKGIEGLDIVWVEEAEKVSQESLDYLVPTVRKAGSEIWCSWNPEDEGSPIDLLFKQQRPDLKVVNVNYWDNLYFPDVLRDEMDYCKRTDYDRYLWIWEGKYRKQSDALIFKGKFVEEDFDTPKDAHFLFGADWGFSVDPTALVRGFTREKKLYLDYEAYAIGCDIDKTPDLFRQVPGSEQAKIVADSARPETISYMRQHGFPRIEHAKKGPNSVEDGIQFLRSFEQIVIHPRCKHTLEEFKSYSFKIDKQSGEPTAIPEDKNNHVIDSLRYMCERFLRREAKISRW